MSTRHALRQLAMQLLFQIDARGEADAEAIQSAALDGPDASEVCDEAFTWAMGAWQQRDHADERVGRLAPDWPAHRQPAVDRAILRLAYYEIITGKTPYKVAINEAIELAKSFGGKQSGPFVNGVLDKLVRELKEENLLPDPPEPHRAPDEHDAWLDDAIDHPDQRGE